jgi:hypothetical protein
MGIGIPLRKLPPPRRSAEDHKVYTRYLILLCAACVSNIGKPTPFPQAWLQDPWSAPLDTWLDDRALDQVEKIQHSHHRPHPPEASLSTNSKHQPPHEHPAILLPSTMSPTHPIPHPSLLLTVKILIPSSRKAEFLSYMRPAFDAAMSEKECCYFILGSRDGELKGFLEGEADGKFEGNENEKGEEAVEVWWTEGWRVEGEGEGGVMGWTGGVEWLMNVSFHESFWCGQLMGAISWDLGGVVGSDE